MFLAISVLPTPFGPITITLVASLRKSRDISASMAARSQRLGHFQSKSQRGLKRPIWASLKRRSKPRRARSCSSQSRRDGTQPSATASVQCASKPCSCSALARVRRISRSVLIGCVLQLVIAVEGMRPYRRILCPHVIGQVGDDGRKLLVLLATALESQAHGVGMGHIALEGFGDSGFEFGCAVACQQAHQGGGDGAEVVAALSGAHQQDLAGRRGLSELIGGAVTVGGALLLDQRVNMRGILDLRALIVAA